MAPIASRATTRSAISSAPPSRLPGSSTTPATETTSAAWSATRSGTARTRSASRAQKTLDRLPNMGAAVASAIQAGCAW